MISTSYIYAIGEAYPNVQCHVVGDASDYDKLIWDAGDPIPEKAALDRWLANHPLPNIQEN